jgi:hypothetical protein
MKASNSAKVRAAVASCTSGLFLAVMATASPAGANPADPSPPPAPLPAVPAPDPVIQAAAPDPAVLPPDGMPHLASPNALPPGSTMDPGATADDSPDVSYLKDLWQAVQNHEISGKEALIMGVAQRGMNTPIPDQAPGPNVPITPGDPALAPPPPASPTGPLPPTP